MDCIPRMAPGSACQACRRLKMRCVKEAQSPCRRCQKTGRECVETVATASVTTRVRKQRVQNLETQSTNSRMSQQHSIRQTVNSATPSSMSSTPLLPTVYSTSSYSNQLDREPCGTGQGLILQDNELLVPRERQRPHQSDITDFISINDVIQLIQIFRDKLMLSIPMLLRGKYEDERGLVATQTDLVICICFVTARFVPGYEDLRKDLNPLVSNFIHGVFSMKSQEDADNLVTLEALIILYIFYKGGAVEKNADTPVDEVHYWSIKATCEAFAMHLNIHRAIEPLKRVLASKTPLRRDDICLRRYLYWLMLYTSSHRVALVTSKPPTIHADSSIRVGPLILQHLKLHDDVRFILAEVELCLLWEKLAVKEPGLKEWWCPVDPGCSEPSMVTFEDIDAALADWMAQTTSYVNKDPRNIVVGLGPHYYFHYTSFCLNTYFIRHLDWNDVQASQLEAIRRCVSSAIGILNLSQLLGPVGREQLRYSTDFLFVTISFCSSFILQAVQKFPGTFPNYSQDLETVRKCALLMKSLGLGESHGEFATGRSILRQHGTTVNFLNQPRSQQDPIDLPSLRANAVETSGSVVRGRSTSEARDVVQWEQIFENTIFEFPDFWETYTEAEPGSG